VGADVDVMLDGARGHRGELPVVAISLRTSGASEVVHWIQERLADARAGRLRSSDVGPPVPHVHHDKEGRAYEHSH
jgi:hypothetical protein